MATPRKYSNELRRRAVEEVLDRGRKIPEVASQLGIGSPETLPVGVEGAARYGGARNHQQPRQPIRPPGS